VFSSMDEVLEAIADSEYREIIGNLQISQYHAGRRFKVDDDGYALVRPTGRGKWVRENRYVMEQFLGRRLFSHETVHHKNGVRTDNRLTNLELWSTYQPKGQRMIDKLVWAQEIIDTYLPIAKAMYLK